MPALTDLPAAEAAIVQMTNDFRAAQKLAPVKQNPQLVAAARAYAKTLGGHQELSHTIDGTTPAQRIERAGYGACLSAENLASLLDSRGFTVKDYAGRAVTGWENSPGHRQNMLQPFVTETGVGVVQAAPNVPKYIAVQLFARPLAAKYSVKVRNEAAAAVSYSVDDRAAKIAPGMIITHTLCSPATIAFDAVGAAARYEARGGQVYTLKASGSGVKVDLGGR
jgi:hypothetical protein